jgi:hypothetical protein
MTPRVLRLRRQCRSSLFPTARADRAARVVTVTRRLWNFAEAQIRRYPSQWAHWSLVDELIEASQ